MHAEKKKVFMTWDRFEIPHPFSRALVTYSEPIWVEESMEGEPLDRFLREAEGRMLELDKVVDPKLGNGYGSLDKPLSSFETAAGVVVLPVALLYSAFIECRNKFFDHGVLHIQRAGVPVVSIGDMTTGGTGKTPIVEYATSYYLGKGKKVAVVSRGYKRATSGMTVVSDGNAILVDSLGGGDEPYQIARKFREAIVIVDKKRVRAARFAVQRLGAEIIILDDGFQHRYLHRDCDIVVVDAKRLPMYTRLLPSGHRREALKGLSRADLIVVTRLDGGTTLDTAVSEVRKYTDAPIVGCRYVPTFFKEAKNDVTVSLETLRGKSAIPFCGIGNPSSFIRILEELQLRPFPVLDFGDHHYYTDSDISTIARKYSELGADYLITTEKDYARLCSKESFRQEFFCKFPVHYLVIEVATVANGELLKSTLDGLLRESKVEKEELGVRA
jgi:tetraacyldisaccharide 4'-kinase